MTDKSRKRTLAACGALLLLLPLSIAWADQVTYQYDTAGRLQTMTYPDGSVVNYSLDPAGNRKVVTCTPASGTSDCTQKSKTTGVLTPQQLAAIQAVLSILLGQ